MLFMTTLYHKLQPHALCFDVILGHGWHCCSRHGCHIPCFAVVCVTRKHSLSQHEVDVEPLFCLDF